MLPLISRMHFYGVRAAGGIAGRQINREISVASVGRALLCRSIDRRSRNLVNFAAEPSPSIRVPAVQVNRSHADWREIPSAAPICAQLTLRDRRRSITV